MLVLLQVKDPLILKTNCGLAVAEIVNVFPICLQVVQLSVLKDTLKILSGLCYDELTNVSLRLVGLLYVIRGNSLHICDKHSLCEIKENLFLNIVFKLGLF